jgi:hypothetical protein
LESDDSRGAAQWLFNRKVDEKNHARVIGWIVTT